MNKFKTEIESIYTSQIAPAASKNEFQQIWGKIQSLKPTKKDFVGLILATSFCVLCILAIRPLEQKQGATKTQSSSLFFYEYMDSVELQ